MFARLTRLILSHRRLASLALAVLVLVPVWGLQWLTIDFSARVMFGSADPALVQWSDSRERWGADDAVIAVIASVDDGTLLTRDRLERLKEVATALEALPGVESVRTVADVPRWQRGPLGRPVPVPLLATVPRGDDAAWRQAVLDDTRLVPGLLSADGRHAALLTTMSISTDNAARLKPVVDAVSATVTSFEDPGWRWRLAGIPAIRAGLVDEISRIAMVTLPGTLLLMGAVLVWMFRRPHGVWIPLVAAVVPTAMLLGTMGWVREPIGIINQVYLTLIPVIAVADAIHVVHRIHDGWRDRLAAGERGPAARDAAIVDAMAHVGPACLLTSLTTMVGFLSLTAAQMTVLQQFGIYAGIGILWSFLTVVLLVPLAMTGALAPSPPAEDGVMDRVLERAADRAVRAPWWTLASTAAVILAFLAAASLVEAENHLVRELPRAHPISEGTVTLDDHLGGTLGLTVELQAEDATFDAPATLAAVDAAEQLLRSMPAVRVAVGPGMLMRGAAEALGGGGQLPTSASAITATWKVIDAADGPALVDDAHRSGRILLSLPDIGARATLALVERLPALLEPILAPQGVQAHITGTSLIAYRGALHIASDLFTSLTLAFAVIATLLALLFRSLRMGAVSLLPNALPLLAGYGILGLIGWPLDIVPAVVLTLALGIAVDDTIHLLSRYREARTDGHEADDAIRIAVRRSGRAVLTTTVLLVAGLGVNAMSTFPTTARFGTLGAWVIVVALACDIAVLPALLTLTKPR